MPPKYEIDKIDRMILSRLATDARKPYSEIAREIYVSGGTVHMRMKKLEQSGIVEGAVLKINYARIGIDITAFIGIYLEKSSLYDAVLKELEKIPEVVECHYTTGNYSMFIKLLCRDTNHLKNVLHDKIQRIKGIERTETLISLEESINRSLPLEL